VGKAGRQSGERLRAENERLREAVRTALDERLREAVRTALDSVDPRMISE